MLSLYIYNNRFVLSILFTLAFIEPLSYSHSMGLDEILGNWGNSGGSATISKIITFVENQDLYNYSNLQLEKLADDLKTIEKAYRPELGGNNISRDTSELWTDYEKAYSSVHKAITKTEYSYTKALPTTPDDTHSSLYRVRLLGAISCLVIVLMYK